jgi:tripartite-type tricarboxylate transporter receptor subunit TctC
MKTASTIAATTALICTALTPLARAEETAYPAKSVELIVPYAAGGGVGAMARVFATEAAALSGQPWVVINREGGGGMVGFSSLARAKPDGYTAVFSPASPLTNLPFLSASMPYQREQFEPVCQVFENVFAIVVLPNSPIHSLRDLVARAKAKPGSLAYGHAGQGSIPHLSVAAIEKHAQVKFNAIPYRGDAPAMLGLLGGAVEFSAIGISSLGGQDLRVLAVLSDQKHPALPDIPTVTQLGYPAISPGLNGVFVPASTPRAVRERLDGWCKAVTASAAFKDGAKKLSQTPQYLSAAAFKARIDGTYKANATLIPALHLDKP